MSAEDVDLNHDPGRIQSRENLDHHARQRSDNFSVGIPVRNETYEDEHSSEMNEPFDNTEFDEHFLRSGPLGRCNDPYCTTCETYWDGHVSTPQQSSSVRNALFGGAKNVQSRIQVWREDWFSVLSPHTGFVQKWNKFFVISCLVAIFIDPLFFLLFSVKQTYFCITFNTTFAMVVTVLRSITDLIYFLHMLLQFKLAYLAPASTPLGKDKWVQNPKEIAKMYLQGWFVLDVCAVLPLPQIMIWLVGPYFHGREANANFVKNILRLTVLLQYVPRCIRFLPLVTGHSTGGSVFETAWANFGINLFIYLLAGHVVGTSWYLFGLQRVNACLQKTCRNETQCNVSYLDCGNGKSINKLVADSKRVDWMNISNASSNCLAGPDISFFYGIYGAAVPVTMNPNVFTKYLYSLFWGFLQISTLAGNLTPSLFIWEVLFTMAVTGLGLLLFALLIGNMQNFLQALGRRQMDMQLQRYNVDLWMKLRKLPPDLRRKVRQAERYKWAVTRGVDESELLEDLPEDLQKEIRRELALGYIKKVRIFQVMEDIVLNAICELLHQKLYIENSKIQQMGYPVDRMLFIVRGNLKIIGDDYSEVKLRDGDFCGEELLRWCLEHAAIQPGRRATVKPIGQIAFSSRDVVCITNVEAFSLEAVDLEFVVKHYNRYMRNPRVQGAIRYESSYFRTWGARSIQAAWRYRKKRLQRLQNKPRNMNGMSTNRGPLLNYQNRDSQARW